MPLEQFLETNFFVCFIIFISFAYFIEEWVCRALHIVTLEMAPL